MKYALITGASKGIGKSMAIALAKRKINLLLIARSGGELSALQTEIKNQYSVEVDILSIDLSQAQAPKLVYNWITEKNYAINILINNAGYGLWGKFEELDLSAQLEMCQLNIITVTSLCHLLLPILSTEKKAYILNVCSTAAYQAVPTLAIYSATKAFVLSFTRALRFELKDGPVSVSCLSPGPVDTGFAHRAGLDAFNKMAEKFNMRPDEVAEIALKGMFAKKSEIIPGFTNIISVYANRILPKGFIEKMAAGIYKT
ncbi:SDR family oxidoreductase [Pedobacter sp. ISL-68]|uniref:SDR family NAD(P)-dependent oxidoreductase n=1 Tax=unclassified Pedobacter TaxID=2628915 RepID=UPI001BE5BF7F|nr:MULTISPECIES: SDR family oxidoreductase [unclassified Pedobacter]MBT2561811.1 SDR family oxidoreductase [Pedobacter sp. ISL-64]MBT2591199.1 SDR family oxidoreductase [Pedobacter sp. ISL-68]